MKLKSLATHAFCGGMGRGSYGNTNRSRETAVAFANVDRIGSVNY